MTDAANFQYPPLYSLEVHLSAEDGPSSSVSFDWDRAPALMWIEAGDEVTEHEVAREDCDYLCDLLGRLRISPGPAGGFVGLGSSTTVSVRRDMNTASYHWAMSAPHGWEPLSEIVEACYRIACRHRPGYYR